MNYCEFKEKSCTQTITANEGKQSVWQLIKRLSSRGEADRPIDTRSILADYVYKQTSLNDIAETFSERGWKYLHVHDCNRCRETIREHLEKLGLLK